MFFGLFGKKKSNKKSTPVVITPPKLTSYQFTSPTGDQYTTTRTGEQEISQSVLNPQSATTVQSSLQALQSLADELNLPDANRLDAINQQAQDFYDLQSQNINAESDTILSQAQSDLSKRFGGAYNATFGADYLARIQGNRLGQLYNAGKQASLLAEDLFSQDENSRVQRFQLFNNFLSNEYNKAQGAAASGSDILQADNGTGQSRAQVAQNALANPSANTNSQRLDLLAKLLPWAITTFTPVPVT